MTTTERGELKKGREAHFSLEEQDPMTDPSQFSAKKRAERKILSQEDLIQISDQVINTYLRLDAHLKSLGTYLVEVDNVRPALALITPRDTREALDEFRRISDQLDSSINLPPQSVLIGDTVRSTLSFFKEEEKLRRGEPKTDYKLYLEETSGFSPHYISDKTLDNERQNILNVLREDFHLKFDPRNPQSVFLAYRAYQQVSRQYTNAWEAIERYKFYDENVSRPKIASILGKDLSNIQYQVVATKAYSFWMMLERPGLSQNLIYFNWHSRHRRKWDEGMLEMYGFHEPDHFVAAHLQQQEILKGNIDPALGIMPIPSPSAFQWEGAAQTIADYAGIELSPDGRLATHVYRAEKYALNNGLYMMENDQRKTIKDIAREIKPYILLRTTGQIETLLREGTTKPLERAYLPVYGLSDLFFKEFYSKASYPQRQKFAQLVHNTPMSPRQLKKAAQRIIESESK